MYVKTPCLDEGCSATLARTDARSCMQDTFENDECRYQVDKKTVGAQEQMDQKVVMGDDQSNGLGGWDGNAVRGVHDRVEMPTRASHQHYEGVVCVGACTVSAVSEDLCTIILCVLLCLACLALCVRPTAYRL